MVLELGSYSQAGGICTSHSLRSGSDLDPQRRPTTAGTREGGEGTNIDDVKCLLFTVYCLLLLLSAQTESVFYGTASASARATVSASSSTSVGVAVLELLTSFASS